MGSNNNSIPTLRQVSERKQAILNQVWFLTTEEQKDLQSHFLMRCDGEALIEAVYEGQPETLGQHYIKYQGEIYLLHFKRINLERLEELTETLPIPMLLSFRTVKARNGLYNTVLVQQRYQEFGLLRYDALSEYNGE